MLLYSRTKVKKNITNTVHPHWENNIHFRIREMSKNMGLYKMYPCTQGILWTKWCFLIHTHFSNDMVVPKGNLCENISLRHNCCQKHGYSVLMDKSHQFFFFRVKLYHIFFKGFCAPCIQDSVEWDVIKHRISGYILLTYMYLESM